MLIIFLCNAEMARSHTGLWIRSWCKQSF